jgi:hypothetical protein
MILHNEELGTPRFSSYPHNRGSVFKEEAESPEYRSFPTEFVAQTKYSPTSTGERHVLDGTTDLCPEMPLLVNALCLRCSLPSAVACHPRRTRSWGGQMNVLLSITQGKHVRFSFCQRAKKTKTNKQKPSFFKSENGVLKHYLVSIPSITYIDSTQHVRGIAAFLPNSACVLLSFIDFFPY